VSLDLVRSIKADLEARGVSLSGPCGAFEVTRRVAWALRSSGAGLHHKEPGQSHCEVNGRRYGVDVVIWPDGRYVDVLGDAGGANTPTWQEHQGDARFYRPAIDPNDAPGPTPPEPPRPPPDDLRAVHAKLDALAADVASLRALVQQLVDRPAPPPADVKFPDYEGAAAIQYLGSAPITLRPKK
jgi:hypothetical protein